MLKRAVMLVLTVIFSCLSAIAISAGQPGTTDTVFNRRFIQKLKPMMPYDQLVKIIGTEGAKAGDNKRSSPPAVSYHWNGERKSALDIRVAEGRVLDIIVTAPKKQRFSLGKNGELVELGK